ncbi:hypothetical protein [Burkholderia cenocepacia]|uniref:hypothetical protein n=1 Tax=Burkholderia TaxID=32008 RepID=UPI001178BB0B|nr:hypothetical protein [Burkholderia cenocepacia]
MKFGVAALAFAAFCGTASASTMSDYSSAVRWISSSHKYLFSGSCSISFGTTGVSLDKPLLYVLSCSGFKETEIYVWPRTKLASLSNGDQRVIPARVLDTDSRHVSIFTAEGETLTFETCGSRC